MNTFETLFWSSYSDEELQRIASDSGQLATYSLKAMEVLNERTLTKTIK